MNKQSKVGKLVAVLAICGATVAFAAKLPKVDVCHIPPGNPANAHTINVSENAVRAHLAHGDTLGPCGVTTQSCADQGGFCSSDGTCPAGSVDAGPGPFADCAASSDLCCLPLG